MTLEAKRRTAFLEEIIEQNEVTEKADSKYYTAERSQDTHKQKELDFNDGLNDLNFKLNIKEERITELSTQNSELRENIHDLKKRVQKMEVENMVQQRQLKVLQIEKDEAIYSSDSHLKLYEKAQSELYEVIEEKDSQSTTIRNLEIL